MTETGRGRRLIARAAIALLALAAATSARASCTANVSGNHIFALSGDTCPFASGTYTPTVAIPGPGTQPIVGLYANNGSITPGEEATAVTVNAIAAGSASYGLYAINGGTIDGGATDGEPLALDVAGVTTSASSSPAVFATGDGSKITLNLLSPTSPALATIVTTGVDSAGVLAESGGSVVLTGGSVMTSADGSVGLNAFSGSIKAMGTTITTEGGLDILSNPSYGVEVSNSGGTVTLINDTIKTSGPGAVGLLAQASGTATLSGTISSHDHRPHKHPGQRDRTLRAERGKDRRLGSDQRQRNHLRNRRDRRLRQRDVADDANDSVDDQDHGRHDHHQWDDGDRRSGAMAAGR